MNYDRVAEFEQIVIVSRYAISYKVLSNRGTIVM